MELSKLMLAIEDLTRVIQKTAEEVLNSLPKLSPEAIRAIEAGSKEMRDISMPDSAWD